MLGQIANKNPSRNLFTVFRIYINIGLVGLRKGRKRKEQRREAIGQIKQPERDHNPELAAD